MVKIYVQHRIISKKINYIVIHYQKIFDLFACVMRQYLQGHRKKFMDKKGTWVGSAWLPDTKQCRSQLLMTPVRGTTRGHPELADFQCLCAKTPTFTMNNIYSISYSFHFKRFSFVCVFTHMGAGALRGKGQIQLNQLSSPSIPFKNNVC